jgi:hypothetical protein
MFKRFLLLVCILGWLVSPLTALGEMIKFYEYDDTDNNIRYQQFYDDIGGTVCYVVITYRHRTTDTEPISSSMECIPLSDLPSQAAHRIFEALKLISKKEGNL